MQFEKIIQIGLLFFLVITYTLQGSNYDYNDSNQLAKDVYIQKDRMLTKSIYYQQIIDKLDKDLRQSKDIDIESLTEQYGGMLTFERVDNNNQLTVLSDRNTLYNYIHLPNIADNKLFLTIKEGGSYYNYKVTVAPELIDQIDKKQHSRIGTVTYIQNNKWKTTPTKYAPNKKLSSDINKNLPDLLPAGDAKGISHYIQNQVIIKFKDNIADNKKKLYIDYLVGKYNINIKKKNNRSIVVYCSEQSTKDLITVLEKNEVNKAGSYIEYIEPHFIYLTNDSNKQSFVPNDSLYEEYQWNLPSIYTEKGWEVTRGEETVIVAVIDTGVDLSHPEFEGKLVDGINLINPNELPQDDDGHGTHVAGIIAANTNNNEGIAGLTWYNKIMPVKVLDQSGSGTLFDVAEGIFWATDNGAKVINLSLGNYAESKYLHEAIKYAYSKDVVLIAATGNDNTDELGYPAAYPEVIGVSATDSYLRRANFSNYGTYLDVMAPGVSIASAYPDGQYAALSGTSMASPHVAGLAALIRSLNPSLSNKEIGEIIKKSADDLGPAGKDKYYGYGEINIERAISYSDKSNLNKSIFLRGIKNMLKTTK